MLFVGLVLLDPRFLRLSWLASSPVRLTSQFVVLSPMSRLAWTWSSI